jgi:hypothetical protein
MKKIFLFLISSLFISSATANANEIVERTPTNCSAVVGMSTQLHEQMATKYQTSMSQLRFLRVSDDCVNLVVDGPRGPLSCVVGELVQLPNGKIVLSHILITENGNSYLNIAGNCWPTTLTY